jgi:hypothetical protein
MTISKKEITKQLQSLGIRVVGEHVRKSDIEALPFLKTGDS